VILELIHVYVTLICCKIQYELPGGAADKCQNASELKSDWL